MNSVETGKEFSRNLLRILERARGRRFSETASDLRVLERDYVQRFKSRPDLALEVRRKVSERLLEEAIKSGCKLSACRSRLNALSRLGFSEIEIKAHWFLIYARGALSRGHRLTAHRVASALSEELQASLDERKSKVNPKKLAAARDLLRLFKQLKETAR
jgi:hypothetical protein